MADYAEVDDVLGAEGACARDESETGANEEEDDDARAREGGAPRIRRLTKRTRYRTMDDEATVDTAALRAILGEENGGDDGGTVATRYDASVDDAFGEPVFGEDGQPALHWLPMDTAVNVVELDGPLVGLHRRGEFPRAAPRQPKLHPKLRIFWKSLLDPQ